MALFPRVTTWVSNQVLTASALNGEFNNILNNAQASSMIGFSATVAQMQQQTSPGGVGSESLSGSISDELQRLRFMSAYTLGKAFWYDQTGRNLGAGNLAVQTADIVNGAVTPAKLGSPVYQVSNSSGTFSTASTSYVDVTDGTNPLSITITTSGRPVMLSLLSDGTGNGSNVTIDGAIGQNELGGRLRLYETTTSTELADSYYRHKFNAVISSTASYTPAGTAGGFTLIGTPATISSTGSMTGGTLAHGFPASFVHYYVPASGTYTYKLQAKSETFGFYTGTVRVNRIKLAAWIL